MITLTGLSPEQMVLAEQIWKCQTMQDVDSIIAVHGREARIIYEMLTLAYWDYTVDDMTVFPEARKLLEPIFGKYYD